MVTLGFVRLDTVHALVEIFLGSTGSGVMVSSAECTNFVILASTIIILKMVKLLAPVTPFDEEPIENRTRIYADTESVTVLLYFVPDVVRDSDHSLI